MINDIRRNFLIPINIITFATSLKYLPIMEAVVKSSPCVMPNFARHAKPKIKRDLDNKFIVTPELLEKLDDIRQRVKNGESTRCRTVEEALNHLESL